MNIIAITQKSLDKPENEDRIVVGRTVLAEGCLQTGISSGVIAVADGVGGNKAGAVASHFVSRKLSEAAHIDYDWLAQVNRELLQLSATTERYAKMATTLSGICIEDDTAVFFSVGNTRVYTLQSGKYLKQLTRDDTTLNYLLSTGQLSGAEAENFDRKNEITACFGGGSQQLGKIKISPRNPVTAPFMLTSDGIHDYVSVDRLEDILEEYGFTMDACEACIAAARAGGSKDDVSIVLIS